MEKKTEKQLQQEEKTQTAAIMLAVEIESNFKLFSYRIITKTDFVARTNDLLRIYQNSIDVGGKPTSKSGRNLKNHTPSLPTLSKV